MSRNIPRGCELGSSSTGQRQVADCCERRNGSSSCIKGKGVRGGVAG
jgi:hypothetical protein